MPSTCSKPPAVSNPTAIDAARKTTIDLISTSFPAAFSSPSAARSQAIVFRISSLERVNPASTSCKRVRRVVSPSTSLTRVVAATLSAVTATDIGFASEVPSRPMTSARYTLFQAASREVSVASAPEQSSSLVVSVLRGVTLTVWETFFRAIPTRSKSRLRPVTRSVPPQALIRTGSAASAESST